MDGATSTIEHPATRAADDGRSLHEFATADLGILRDFFADADDAAEGPTDAAGEDESAFGEPSHEHLQAIVTQYGKYVALFVGAGLISGAVVHFPLAPLRYSLIGAVGALVFTAASVVAERAGRSAAGLARIAVSALALALGIGMVSGSIQHFQDIPQRAVVLIPVGVVLSFAAFLVRNEKRPRREDLTAAVMWSLVVAIVLFEGLGRVAGAVGTQPAGHHGKTPAPASGAGPGGAGAAPATETADEGHAH